MTNSTPCSETELTRLIVTASRSSFSDAQATLGADELIGYAILSHDTADSCGAVMLTRSGLARRLEMPDEDVWFEPVEWDVFPRDPHFDGVNAALQALYAAGEASDEGAGDASAESGEVDWHDAFRELVFRCCTAALHALVQDGFFGSAQQRDGLFVFFSLSDSETSRTHGSAWAQRLNTRPVADAYQAWNQRPGLPREPARAP